VFATRFSGGEGGRDGLENELRQLGVKQKNGRPNHPQTRARPSDFSKPSRSGWPPSSPSLVRWGDLLPHRRLLPSRPPPKVSATRWQARARCGVKRCRAFSPSS